MQIIEYEFLPRVERGKNAVRLPEKRMQSDRHKSKCTNVHLKLLFY